MRRGVRDYPAGANSDNRNIIERDHRLPGQRRRWSRVCAESTARGGATGAVPCCPTSARSLPRWRPPSLFCCRVWRGRDVARCAGEPRRLIACRSGAAGQAVAVEPQPLDGDRNAGTDPARQGARGRTSPAANEPAPAAIEPPALEREQAPQPVAAIPETPPIASVPAEPDPDQREVAALLPDLTGELPAARKPSRRLSRSPIRACRGCAASHRGTARAALACSNPRRDRRSLS